MNRWIYTGALGAILMLFVAWSLFSLFHYPIENIDLFDESKDQGIIDKENTRVQLLLKNKINQSWLLFDTEDLVREIGKLSWIDEVSISKPTLGTLIVKIKKKQPLFRWHRGLLISSQGDLISVDDNVWQSYDSLIEVEMDNMSSSTSHFPLLVGLGNFWTSASSYELMGLQSVRVSLPNKLELFFDGYTLVVDADEVEYQVLRFIQWEQHLPNDVIKEGSLLDLRYSEAFSISEP